MIVLTVTEISKRFSPEPVLDQVSFDLRQGEHVGLVGPNGTGKSTLLNILRGELESDAGEIVLGGSSTIGFIAQHPDQEHRVVWDVAAEAMSELTNLAKRSDDLAQQMSTAKDPQEIDSLGEQFERIQEQITTKGGFNIDHKIAEVLHGLGFDEDYFHKPLTQLSGGQVRRVMLAKLLLEQPDVMLLDEPSNHLDIASTEWLEDYLSNTRSAFIIVSHDRYLLDRVTTRTLELINAKLDSYPGNFTKYTGLKQERLEIERKTYEKQKAEIEKLEDFIRKHHHGQKSAQAEDRRKKLERIELVDLPREISTPPMKFRSVGRAGDIVLRAKHLTKSYDQTLFKDLTFDILRGERWCIVGPNGSGKTTLLRGLIGQIELDEGEVTLGANVKPGYFDQQLAFSDENMLAIDAVRPDHKEFFEQQRRDLLASFGINGDMVFQPIKSLSGGERNRVALSYLAASDANFLILDEPTNHLDLWARSALESALLKFEGTLLFVSHDRYFINRVADHLIYVDNGSFHVLDGNYDALRYHLQQQAHYRQQETGKASAKSNNQDSESNSKKKSDDRPPKRKYPFRKLAEIEQEIQQREEKLTELHHKMMQPETLRDGRLVKETQNELETEQDALAQLYEHWEQEAERQ